MNPIKIAKNVIESHRKKRNSAELDTPVHWKGLQMTIKEAWAVVEAFEEKKAEYLEWHMNTQTGADVTKTVFEGLSQAAQSTGKGLSAFPLTFLAGELVNGTSKGVSKLGNVISENIRDINEKRHTPLIQEFNKYIASLEEAISKAQR